MYKIAKTKRIIFMSNDQLYDLGIVTSYFQCLVLVTLAEAICCVADFSIRDY